MRPAEIAELLKSLAVEVRDFVASALAPMAAKLAELEHRLSALPAPEKGERGDRGPSAYELALAGGFTGTEAEWLASLRGAEGERGDNGKSVTAEELMPLVRDEVIKQVAEIPRPRFVTLQELQPLMQETVDAVEKSQQRVRELVAAAVAELPVPKDGKDGLSVTLDDVRPLVEAAVAAIPVPRDGEDGRSVTLDDVRPLIDQAVAAIPRPQDGKSVTVEELQPVLRELVEAAVAAIPVPRDGEDGRSVTVDDMRPLVERAVADIPRPKDGQDGKDGENVPIEVVTALVVGEVAKAVAALPRPQDGRDATAIEPLPAIDPTRSYPRGTWAKHNRGLWLARTITDGMNGWDCVVAGVAALEVTSDGMRAVRVRTVLSDGTGDSVEFVLPAMNYRGAWAPGGYTPGDTVSWDGSMWHCEQPTTDRPGSSPAWRLCVKHGRDGKDGVRGPKGERGPEGKPGRDFTGYRT